MTTSSPMCRDKSLSLGHDEPPRKNTYTGNKQRTRTINLGLNVGMKTSGIAGVTLSDADGTTIQAADDMVCLKIKKLRFILNPMFSLHHLGS